MNRRGFLRSLLAAGTAAVAVRTGLARIEVQPKPSISECYARWDPTTSRVLLFGGGHADSRENAVYAFNPYTNTFSTL